MDRGVGKVKERAAMGPLTFVAFSGTAPLSERMGSSMVAGFCMQSQDKLRPSE